MEVGVLNGEKRTEKGGWLSGPEWGTKGVRDCRQCSKQVRAVTVRWNISGIEQPMLGISRT